MLRLRKNGRAKRNILFKYARWSYISVGKVESVALVVVAHTSRDDRIRLISARPAARKERQAYHERIR